MGLKFKDDINIGRRQFLYRLAGVAGGLLVATLDQSSACAASRRGSGADEGAPEASFSQADNAFSTYELAADGSPLIGRAHRVSVCADETLLDIGRRFDLGYWDIVLANPGIDIWMPGVGTRALIPRKFILPRAPREGIVINIPELRLYYYPPAAKGKARQVITHPVGLGRQDWATPLGRASVVEKIPQPTWYPPASIRAEHAARGEKLPGIVPPGPNNPLGEYVLLLSIPGYLIHGTNKPYGVGMRVSHGCIRLYPEDIARFFARVSRKTPVHIVDQPYKLAWHQGELWLEVQPSPEADDFTSMNRERHLAMLARLHQEVEHTAHAAGYTVAHREFDLQLRRFSGVPEPVPLI
ncbi:L,D-transpeptidase family protein [Nitrococcus mobilis]|uniref:ErfK/YbiS/YcfS/YnhG family protein n=1 Tax=Nitrococcus mobilis Nb-231 TaxID=314278 RepID=A4BNW5_9GAMM|nr:L,D-transpeptidase family protein [Nitrococcus mobilis]EAR22914.1 ErfK/YbiS/YcfS/YnhG family protein [Nitrococcus mobilis Nb-231]